MWQFERWANIHIFLNPKYLPIPNCLKNCKSAYSGHLRARLFVHRTHHTKTLCTHKHVAVCRVCVISRPDVKITFWINGMQVSPSKKSIMSDRRWAISFLSIQLSSNHQGTPLLFSARADCSQVLVITWTKLKTNIIKSIVISQPDKFTKLIWK